MTDEIRPDQPDEGTTMGPAAGQATTTPAEDRLRQLTGFIEAARWFGGKGRGPQVTAVRRLGVIADEGPRVVVDLAEVTYTDGVTELYQLPLALYDEPEHRLDHAFAGWWEDPDVGWTHAYDRELAALALKQAQGDADQCPAGVRFALVSGEGKVMQHPDVRAQRPEPEGCRPVPMCDAGNVQPAGRERTADHDAAKDDVGKHWHVLPLP